MQDKTRRRRLCKSCHSEYIRKRKFNLEDNEYQKLLEKQNGRCAICQSDTPEKRSLAVDHCHETDKIRGLLCSKCNTGIGSFKDNIQLLENAIAYLNKEKD